MGWSTGSRIFSEIIEVLQKQVPDDGVREEIYDELIQLFWNDYDCDTLDECKGEDKSFDKAFKNFIGIDEDEDIWDEDDNDRGC
jgi:hypothetical protein